MGFWYFAFKSLRRFFIGIKKDLATIFLEFLSQAVMDLLGSYQANA
jgi:hypothetical protein